MNIQSLHNIFAFLGIFSIMTGTIGNSVAQYNQSSFTTPPLDNLTGIAEGNTTSSNSTSTSDSSEESRDN